MTHTSLHRLVIFAASLWEVVLSENLKPNHITLRSLKTIVSQYIAEKRIKHYVARVSPKNEMFLVIQVIILHAFRC